jgi:hypothetical protein
MSTELGRNRVKQREHMLLSFERPAASRPFCATPCCGPARLGIAKSSASVPKSFLARGSRPLPDLENCTVGQRVWDKDPKDLASCRILPEVPGSLGNHRALRNGVAFRGGA